MKENIDNSEILLSIITINLNNKIGLIKTVESVKAQTNKNFEHIVIDGESIDGSAEFINQNKSFFKHLIIEKDNGIYSAQNKGIKKANGEYCLFLNSGDVLFSENTIQLIQDNLKICNKNEIGIYYFNVWIQDKIGVIKKKVYKENLTPFYLCLEIINHQSQLIKTELLKKYNGYNENLKMAADYELFVNYIFEKKIKSKYIPIEISIYDLQGISAVGSGRELYAKEHSEIRNKYFKEEMNRIEDLNFFTQSIGTENFEYSLKSHAKARIVKQKFISLLKKFPLLDKILYFFLNIIFYFKKVLKKIG